MRLSVGFVYQRMISYKNKKAFKIQISASFLKAIFEVREKCIFLMLYKDFVLGFKIKLEFEFWTPQVMPEYSIFSKCYILQGCDMSHVTNNLYFLPDMVKIYVEEYSTSWK